MIYQKHLTLKLEKEMQKYGFVRSETWVKDQWWCKTYLNYLKVHFDIVTLLINMYNMTYDILEFNP